MIEGPMSGGSEARESTSLALDKLIEVYKARLTISLALLVGFVTMIGFGVDTANAELFLVAAAVPLLALVVDEVLARVLGDPMMYRMVMGEQAKGDSEGLGHLMLLFRGIPGEDLEALSQVLNPAERRLAFRRLRVRSARPRRIGFFLVGTLGSIGIWALVEFGVLGL